MCTDRRRRYQSQAHTPSTGIKNQNACECRTNSHLAIWWPWKFEKKITQIRIPGVIGSRKHAGVVPAMKMASRKTNRGHREANGRCGLTCGQLKELEPRNACTRRYALPDDDDDDDDRTTDAPSFRGWFLAVVPRGNSRTFSGWHSNAFITRNRQYLRLVHVRDNVRRLERNANPLIRADSAGKHGAGSPRRSLSFLSSYTVVERQFSRGRNLPVASAVRGSRW